MRTLTLLSLLLLSACSTARHNATAGKPVRVEVTMLVAQYATPSGSIDLTTLLGEPQSVLADFLPLHPFTIIAVSDAAQDQPKVMTAQSSHEQLVRALDEATDTWVVSRNEHLQLADSGAKLHMSVGLALYRGPGGSFIQGVPSRPEDAWTLHLKPLHTADGQVRVEVQPGIDANKLKWLGPTSQPVKAPANHRLAFHAPPGQTIVVANLFPRIVEPAPHPVSGEPEEPPPAEPETQYEIIVLIRVINP